MSNPIPDSWFHRMKAATRDLVKACGGIVRAGEIALISKSEMSRMQSATDPALIGIAQVLALEADCGLPFVTTVVQRIESVREEIESYNRDLADIFPEAKSNGFDRAALRKVVNIRAKRRKDPAAFEEKEAQVEIYLNGLAKAEADEASRALARPRGHAREAAE